MALDNSMLQAESVNQTADINSNISPLNIQAGETEAIAPTASLDFGTADDPLGDLNGLNLEMFDNPIEQENPNPTIAPGPGDPPGKKKELTMAQLMSDYNKQRSEAKNWAGNLSREAVMTRNPLLAYGNYEFDRYATNVDRYLGYGKETFNRLGFNPLLKSDAVEQHYNANTTYWQDFKRMSGQFGGLMGTAFVSNYESIGRLFDGQSVLTGDTKGSRSFERAMALGSSSKGGVRGFGINLALNMAYTAGIAANIAFEEALIALGSGLMAAPTGGASLGAGAAGTAYEMGRVARLGTRFAEGINTAFKGKEVAGMWRGGAEMLKSFKNVNNAREFYTGIRTGAGVFARGAANFVNPFARTTEIIGGIRAGETGYRNLSNAAKVSKTFGGFYRDMRDSWYAISESQLEGGGVYNQVLQSNIAEYVDKNGGKLPEGEELRKIYQDAEAASRLTTIANIPFIYFSNRMVFDGLFKFKGISNAMEAADKAVRTGVRKGLTFDLSTRALKEVGKTSLFSVSNIYKKPKLYFGTLLNYTKANIAETIQELGQETISKSVTDYYTNVYKNPLLGGSDYAKSTFNSAFQHYLTSKEGLDVALSGFLMGGMMHGATSTLTKGLNKAGELYSQYITPEKYKEYLYNKENALKEAIINANAILSDPEKYFSSKKESMVAQQRTSQNMIEAELADDDKGFHDAKDAKAFDHIFTALDNDTYDLVVDGLKEMRGLSEEDLRSAFNLPEGVNAKDKLDKYISRAEQIKDRYEYFNNKLKNPFDPAAFKKGTEEHLQEFIAFKSFNDAKKAAIASEYGFNRSVERMVSVFNDLVSDAPVAKASASDYTVLQNVKSIKDEIRLLKDEVASLQQAGDAEMKALAKKKQKKLDALKEYSEALDKHLKGKKVERVNENGEVVTAIEDENIDELEEKYNSYIKAIADITETGYVFNEKIGSSFKKLLDYYNLDNDSKYYAEAVNSLLNPDNFSRYAQRVSSSLNELWNTREDVTKDSMKNYFSVVEADQLVTAMGLTGAIVDPAQMEDLVRKGKRPTAFFDIQNNKVIDRSDSRYDRLQNMIDAFVNLKKDNTAFKTEEEEKADEAAAQPTAQVVTPQPVVTPVQPTGMPADLEARLQAGYNAYMEENPDADLSYEDYVDTTRAAKRIIKDYELEKGAKVQPTAPVTAPVVPVPTPAPAAPAAPVATPVSDIEAKKADIETRRQASLNSIEESYDKGSDLNIGKAIITDASGNKTTVSDMKDAVSKDDPFQRLKDKINTIYDTELDALEEQEIDTVDQVQTRLNDDLGVTSKITIDTYLNGLHYLQTEDGKYYIIPDSNASGYSDVFAKEVTKEQIIKPFRTEAEWKKVGINVTPSKEVKPVEAPKAQPKPITIQNGIVEIQPTSTDTYSETYTFTVKDGKVVSGVHDTYFQGEYKDTQTSTPISDPAEKYNELSARYKEEQITQKSSDAASKEVVKGTEKAKSILDSVSSLKDMPNTMFTGSSKVTTDLLQLVADGVLEPQDLKTLVEARRQQLAKNLSVSDLKKGDFITFADGKKGWVTSVTRAGTIQLKLVGTPKNEYAFMNIEDIAKNISMLEEGKKVPPQPAEETAPISEQDKSEVEASRDSVDGFTSDVARVQKANDDVLKNTKNSNDDNMNNLFDQLGCKTGK